MRRRIDPERHSADNREAGRRQVERELLGDSQPVRARSARTDDRDRRRVIEPREDRPFPHPEQARKITVEVAEARRVGLVSSRAAPYVDGHAIAPVRG